MYKLAGAAVIVLELTVMMNSALMAAPLIVGAAVIGVGVLLWLKGEDTDY